MSDVSKSLRIRPSPPAWMITLSARLNAHDFIEIDQDIKYLPAVLHSLEQGQ
jgi:hypothetical protein